MKPDQVLAEAIYELKRALENPALEPNGIVVRALAESPYPWSLLDAGDDVVRAFEMAFGANAYPTVPLGMEEDAGVEEPIDVGNWAAALKQDPGTWRKIAEFEFTGSTLAGNMDPVYKKAANMADSIRSSRAIKAFQPAGSFEAVVRTLRAQDALQVWARYVGAPDPRGPGGSHEVLSQRVPYPLRCGHDFRDV